MSIPENSDPGPVAIGTWSGGRFMHFGEPLDDQRYLALITPDESIRTVMTADVYGTGEADRMLGRAIAGRRRDEICVVGAVGHDFYEGERDGPRGFPRFTDPRLRGPERYGDYLADFRGEQYREQVFAYVDREDSPRPVLFQCEILRGAGFRKIDILHKNTCFAAFGACKL